MVRHWLHECVDVVRHNDVFTKYVALSVKVIQNAFDKSLNLWSGQYAGAILSVQPMMNPLGEVAMILFDLVFVVGRRILGEPNSLFLIQSC